MIYETVTDREKQEQVATIVAAMCGWRFQMTESLNRQDVYFLDHNNRRFVAEIKVRGKKYETLMIDKSKVLALLDKAFASFSVPLLVIAWEPEQELGLLKVNRSMIDSLRVAPGGRNDRGDPNDIDECVFIPVDLFSTKKVGEWPW